MSSSKNQMTNEELEKLIEGELSKIIDAVVTKSPQDILSDEVDGVVAKSGNLQNDEYLRIMKMPIKHDFSEKCH